MRFKLKNSNIFPLPGNPHMLHLATIGYSLREFIVMLGIMGPASGKIYIEEIVLESKDFSKDVFANCKFIEDDNLANDLSEFVEEKGIRDMKKIADTIIDMGNAGWLNQNHGLLGTDSKK